MGLNVQLILDLLDFSAGVRFTLDLYSFEFMFLQPFLFIDFGVASHDGNGL